MGLNATYASGKRDNNKVSISKFIYLDKLSKIINIRFNDINFSLKLYKFLIYINVLFRTFLTYNQYHQFSKWITVTYKFLR